MFFNVTYSLKILSCVLSSFLIFNLELYELKELFDNNDEEILEYISYVRAYTPKEAAAT